jgi:hypothetical protein
MYQIQVTGESFNSSFIVPSFWGALSVRLVIEGTIVITVPFIVSFLFDAFSLLAVVFNSVVCISAVDHVTQVSVIPISLSAVFLRWSGTTSQVPMRTLSVVKLLTRDTVVAVETWVRDCGCIQPCLEVVNMCIDFFIISGS